MSHKENSDNQDQNQSFPQFEINNENLEGKNDLAINLTRKNQREIGHEILLEEENKTYKLSFHPLGEKIKIFLLEKDIFPARSFEIMIPLSEFPQESFSKSVKEITDELNLNDNKINFKINKTSVGTLELEMNSNNIHNIKYELNENMIDDREMLKQLYEKYKSIKKEQEENYDMFRNRLKNVEEILGKINDDKMELNKEDSKRESIKIVKEEKSETKSSKYQSKKNLKKEGKKKK